MVSYYVFEGIKWDCVLVCLILKLCFGAKRQRDVVKAISGLIYLDLDRFRATKLQYPKQQVALTYKKPRPYA